MRTRRRWLAAVSGLAALGAAVLAPGAAAEPRAVVTEASVVEDGGRTRFVLSVDREIEFRVFALADPYRVIIDLPEVSFEIPAEAGDVARGLVTAFRFGLFSAGRSRVVIDAAAPVIMAEPEIHPASGDLPARLVVEFAETTREEFLESVALNGGRRAGAAAPPPIRAMIAPTPEVRNAKPVIVIDPGHGGIDPGAHSRSGALEKDLVLDFGKALSEKLRATGSFGVVMTRERDVFLKLSDRREIAQDNNADLFVSIHADSIRWSSVRGATVYTISDKASDEEAAALAAQENRSDAVAGVALEEFPDAVGDILIELRRRDTKNRSIDFAKVAVKAMRRQIKLNRNPHRSAGFMVLKVNDVPSVLLELGYLSNRQDERAMSSDEWREKATDSVVEAMERYFATRIAGAD